MNCRQVQDQLFAARAESPVADLQAPEVADHLATCAECRRLRDGLANALRDWQNDTAAVAVPDPQQEWHAVRRRIRQETAQPATNTVWTGLLRVAAPLTAVAAIALIVWQARSPGQAPELEPSSSLVAQKEDGFDGNWPEMDQHFAFSAHAEFVETDNEDASPFVYVDDESGWLIVWASDPPDEASI